MEHPNSEKGSGEENVSGLLITLISEKNHQFLLG